MKSIKTIFAFLPISYAVLSWLFFINSYEVLGVTMLIFSVLFGMMAFMLYATELDKRKNNNPNKL